MEDTAEKGEKPKDSVQLLQEFCTKFRLGHVLYHLTAESKGEEGKYHEIQVSVHSLGLSASGAAKAKKQAKHIAAENLIGKILQAAKAESSLHEYSQENVAQFYEYLKHFRIAQEDTNLINMTDRPLLLKELCSSKNYPPPAYNLKSSEGPSHERMFTMFCQVLDHETIGEGKSKKLAKRIAADQMLQLLSKSVEANYPPL